MNSPFEMSLRGALFVTTPALAHALSRAAASAGEQSPNQQEIASQNALAMT